MWRTGSPYVSSTGRARATASSVPPTYTVSRPAAATAPPPLTGASITCDAARRGRVGDLGAIVGADRGVQREDAARRHPGEHTARPERDLADRGAVGDADPDHVARPPELDRIGGERGRARRTARAIAARRAQSVVGTPCSMIRCAMPAPWLPRPMKPALVTAPPGYLKPVQERHNRGGVPSCDSVGTR